MAQGGEQPQTIGSYRVESRLGQGGMGEVFLAWDERLGRHVAIKRIRHDRAGSATARERFRREARTAAGLSHPAIVQIYDVVEEAPGETTGDAIVMERVVGSTVAERTATGPFALREALDLAREVAEGLAEAHGRGLVHRDLKAENVLVTPAGHAKILDFGLARPLEATTADPSLTATGAVLGTVRAMAPEQACGQPPDPRSDLFSLGVLLYEMLTARSPFEGTSPADTLRRVLAQPPPPLPARLPPELVRLVESLLAKEPSQRPASARQVALELARIAGSSRDAALHGQTAAGSGTLAPGLSQTPTAEGPPPRTRAESRPLPRRRRLAVPLTILALAVLALLLVGAALLLPRLRSGPPLRVVVPPPAAAPELARVASTVRVAVLGHLATREGLSVVEPSSLPPELAAPGSDAVAVARAVAADEVLTAQIEAWGEGGCRVVLRRLRGGDGSVAWLGSFEAPTEVRRLRLTADAVAAQLDRAYEGLAPRPGTPRQEVSDADYATFLEVQHRIYEGEVQWGPEMERLETVVAGSPRFLEGLLLAANVALNLYTDRREAAWLERARELAGRAQSLYEADPRPLFTRFQIALYTDRLEEAAAILDELEVLTPGDPAVTAFRGRLAERRGDLPAALEALRETVEQRPSWLALYQLAGAELKAGKVTAARGHLQELLERSPGNLWGRQRLAGLELMYGDLEAAVDLYAALAAESPSRSFFTNLGIAHFLLGRFAEAAAGYERALELDPDHPIALFNLAEARLAGGAEAEAKGLYAQVLERLTPGEGGETPTPVDAMTRAQCLAHLGRAQEAVTLAQETLRRHGDDSEVLYQAALVYALVGDRTSALANARRALEAGVQPRWFEIPAFEGLRAELGLP